MLKDQYPVINDSFEVAVLICLLLKSVGNLNEDLIFRILTLDNMVGAFTITEGLSIIESKDLAKKNKKGFYIVDEQGIFLANEFYKRIPAAVREKSLAEGVRLNKLSELRKSIDWNIEKKGNGYIFRLRFLNEMGGEDIMDLKIYAPSHESALTMEKNFLSNPIEAFERIMYIFTS